METRAMRNKLASAAVLLLSVLVSVAWTDALIPSEGPTTTFTVVSNEPSPTYQLFRIEMAAP